jgi:hypothetical protein
MVAGKWNVQYYHEIGIRNSAMESDEELEQDLYHPEHHKSANEPENVTAMTIESFLYFCI